MTDVLRDWARDLFGGLFVADVPETIPLRLLGLQPPVPDRATIAAAFRRRLLEIHPDLQHAYDHPQIQAAAETALSEAIEVRELVWARDELLRLRPESVTDKTSTARESRLSVTLKPHPFARKCLKCGRELTEAESRVRTWKGRRALWCWRCCSADDAARRRERLRLRRCNRSCAGPGCTAIFTPPRADGRFCSPRCRQAAHRASRITKAAVGDGRHP